MSIDYHWHEHDDWWADAASVLFTENRLHSAPEEVDRIITLLSMPRGAAVLDLCCGVGRHSLELARRGHPVTGVDRTAAYLEQAKAQASKDGLQVEFVKGDMRTFCRPECFDIVLNMYTSFGYFEERDEDREVIANIYRSLRKDGFVLMEMIGKEILARIFHARVWYEQDDTIILEERKVAANWSRMDNRWILLRGSDRRELTFSVRLYSATELTNLLLDCGFAHVEVYGSLDGDSYDHTAKRLVVVAQK
ncbi:MAG: class I SAM-dependent methyltransferase [candidate division Zixibacteria bacterium]|nr:class I SAM-dependent methyltransferase [candidate division Zixibacteria bacterium]